MMGLTLQDTLCSWFMMFCSTRMSIYALFGDGPKSKFLLYAMIFSHQCVFFWLESHYTNGKRRTKYRQAKVSLLFCQILINRTESLLGWVTFLVQIGSQSLGFSYSGLRKFHQVYFGSQNFCFDTTKMVQDLFAQENEPSTTPSM